MKLLKRLGILGLGALSAGFANVALAQSDMPPLPQPRPNTDIETGTCLSFNLMSQVLKKDTYKPIYYMVAEEERNAPFSALLGIDVPSVAVPYGLYAKEDGKGEWLILSTDDTEACIRDTGVALHQNQNKDGVWEVKTPSTQAMWPMVEARCAAEMQAIDDYAGDRGDAIVFNALTDTGAIMKIIQSPQENGKAAIIFVQPNLIKEECSMSEKSFSAAMPVKDNIVSVYGHFEPARIDPFILDTPLERFFVAPTNTLASPTVL